MRAAFELVKAHYDANSKGDLAGMVADFAPDICWTEMDGFPQAGTYVGAEAVVKNVFAALGKKFDGYAFKLERLIDAGDDVVGVGEYSGTFKATGKPFKARVAHVWRVENERISSFEQFTDTLRVAESMR